MRPRSRTKRSGFSLLAVLFGVAAITIILGVALPSMTNAIANVKVRGNMTSVSGLLQNTRILAVKLNRTMTARYLVRTTSPFGLVYYAKNATDSSPLASSDPQVELEAPITRYTTPTGASAPAAINTTTLGFTPQTGDPSFNSRGLPCSYSGGTCTSNGFIAYYKDDRISSSSGWSAISISPAGRIKRWFWNESAWTD
ncbi:hypothetical protein E6H18_08575 [Candidatus Bathyarchaeota archaeon]|nr:MAG: hypothetical protein E6H18_08575 [Candidatus Bathyarchaeota archaeon]